MPSAYKINVSQCSATSTSNKAYMCLVCMPSAYKINVSQCSATTILILLHFFVSSVSSPPFFFLSFFFFVWFWIVIFAIFYTCSFFIHSLAYSPNPPTHALKQIAPYPFTTLNPHLGVVEFPDFHRITIADIPGLAKGAHMNVGLGFAFLRHVERSRVFAYVLDMRWAFRGKKKKQTEKKNRKEMKSLDIIASAMR